LTVSLSSVLASGATIAIGRQFSASRFWDDIALNKATAFTYIGELCRYLLQAPTSALETQHRLRLACGNGLRGDVWEAFQSRFAIPEVLEFYAATEGNFSLYNVEGRVGSIGRVPSLLAHRFPAAIIQLDADQRAPLRGPDGLCLPCARGEVGEAVGRIGKADQGGGRFEGYTDRAETEKKILRDVFAKGDAWFRTGDLMRLDEQGFFYFVDRVGDTFRWKGENVATTEVNEAIGHCAGVIEASVYGDTGPGAEGRAGMAALAVAPGFDRDALHATLAERLPAYARPLFLRIVPHFAHTETFKQKKSLLADEGFDPDRIRDPLYVDRDGRYQPLDREAFARICRDGGRPRAGTAPSAA
jgi:fatty-acyl-CoA synthase